MNNSPEPPSFDQAETVLPPAVRGVVDPHVRNSHVRRLAGRAVPVKAAIVNVDLARRRARLATLMRAPQIATAQRGIDRVLGTDLGSADQVGQLDCFVELQRISRARAASILDERLANYARLTPQQAAHLAMARVRVHIERHVAERSDQPGAAEQLAMHTEDLERLEAMLFAESLQQLSPDEIDAIREICACRHFDRTQQPSDIAAAATDLAAETSSAERMRA
jgi:hypothetical protein